MTSATAGAASGEAAFCDFKFSEFFEKRVLTDAICRFTAIPHPIEWLLIQIWLRTIGLLS
jgi:hypothetical protein